MGIDTRYTCDECGHFTTGIEMPASWCQRTMKVKFFIQGHGGCFRESRVILCPACTAASLTDSEKSYHG